MNVLQIYQKIRTDLSLRFCFNSQHGARLYISIFLYLEKITDDADMKPICLFSKFDPTKFAP